MVHTVHQVLRIVCHSAVASVQYAYAAKKIVCNCWTNTNSPLMTATADLYQILLTQRAFYRLALELARSKGGDICD